MANNKWTKHFILRSPEEFNLFITEHNSKLFNLNLDNDKVIENLTTQFSEKLRNITPFGVNQIRKVFTELARDFHMKSVSELHESYYLFRGYSHAYAIDKISEIQKTRSKRCVEFWIKKGYSHIEAKEKVSEIQINNGRKLGDKLRNNIDFAKSFSVWSIDHWLKKGYTIEDAEYKIKTFNPSCQEFYETSEAYKLGRENISNRVKVLWKNGVYDDKVKMIQTRYTSKQESVFFGMLKTFIPEVIYEPFGINVRQYSDDFYYVYDAYIKTANGIILLEYDGTYWHNLEKDIARDSLVLSSRDDVMGVIRTNDYYFYKNQINIKDFKDAIEKIKSKESNRILLYESP